jgi:hypothetical protein
MTQSTDITGATCHKTEPHEAHPIVGSFRGSCSGINADQWIADQVAQLSENELVLVKTVLEEIRAGRPVEHFMPGTKVYADSWGSVEFIVQGTAPWYDENGPPARNREGHRLPVAARAGDQGGRRNNKFTPLHTRGSV